MESGDSERAFLVVSPVLEEEEGNREALILRSMAACDMGEPDLGLEDLEELLKLDPENTEAWVEWCRCMIAANKLSRALHELQSLLKEFPEDGEVLYLMATVADLAGKPEIADTFFRKANILEPGLCAMPFRVSDSEFVEMAMEAVDNLPEEISYCISKVTIAVQDLPPSELIGRNGRFFPPTINGLCNKPPGTYFQICNTRNIVPCEITLFKRNLERYAQNRQDLIDDVYQTVLYEVGHFLGLSAEDVNILTLS